ncbi:hypothetical protein [Lacticaseibacillus suibinensis]|uniref:hypothetical protein n=1 Tax=Lacticaseibacillus suibinensis TaxID=2486011 RepID=UPI000F784EFB|nr:hypothetical protein [Lacticaseibacillus suibinensis]
MQVLSSIMKLISTGIAGYGGYMVVMGAVTLGGNLKDSNGPGIRSAILEIVGGVIISAAAVYFTTIKFT